MQAAHRNLWESPYRKLPILASGVWQAEVEADRRQGYGYSFGTRGATRPVSP